MFAVIGPAWPNVIAQVVVSGFRPHVRRNRPGMTERAYPESRWADIGDIPAEIHPAPMAARVSARRAWRG
jgi:hypothetical protein